MFTIMVATEFLKPMLAYGKNYNAEKMMVANKTFVINKKQGW